MSFLKTVGVEAVSDDVTVSGTSSGWADGWRHLIAAIAKIDGRATLRAGLCRRRHPIAIYCSPAHGKILNDKFFDP